MLADPTNFAFDSGQVLEELFGDLEVVPESPTIREWDRRDTVLSKSDSCFASH
jgi:hypothetical protein